MAGQKISFDLELSNKIFKSNLDSLVTVSRDSIQEQKKQYQALIDKLSIDQEVDGWLDKSSHYENIDWILFNSIFLSCFSFFEHHLFKLCRIVEDRTNNKIQLEDISGKGIYKFCSYLFLVGGIQGADKSTNDWQEVLYFQKVRNLIAHNGGFMLSDKTKKLQNHECYNFLKKYKVIMAGTFGIIRIRDIDFCDAFRDLTSKLSDSLTKEISENLEKNSR